MSEYKLLPKINLVLLKYIIFEWFVGKSYEYMYYENGSYFPLWEVLNDGADEYQEPANARRYIKWFYNHIIEIDPEYAVTDDKTEEWLNKDGNRDKLMELLEKNMMNVRECAIADVEALIKLEEESKRASAYVDAKIAAHRKKKLKKEDIEQENRQKEAIEAAKRENEQLKKEDIEQENRQKRENERLKNEAIEAAKLNEEQTKAFTLLTNLACYYPKDGLLPVRMLQILAVILRIENDQEDALWNAISAKVWTSALEDLKMFNTVLKKYE